VGSSAVISPDGRSLILVVTTEGRTQLWLRKLDSQIPQALAGTDNAINPFWSPDSLNIGFFADGKLKRINVTGGSSQTVCDIPRPYAVGTWGRKGTILISAETIYRVTASGGDRLTVVEPDAARQEWACGWPYFLPDGNHFLYVSMAAKNELRIGALESKEVIDVMPVDSRVIYTTPGDLLFVKEGTLLAQAFDLSRLKISGEPVTVAEKLLYFEPTGFADISASDNGVLVYQAGTNFSRLSWYSRDGAQLGDVGKAADYSWVRLSPDGQRLAVDIGDQHTGTTDIWLFDLTRGNASRFTSDPGVEWSPVWSPDNKRIAFTTNRGAPPFIHVKGLGDIGSGESLNQPSGWTQFVWDWVKTPAGEFIIYGDGTPQTNYDLLILPLSGDQKSRTFLNTKFSEEEARFSPDGKWMAYASNESGRREVYLRPFQGGEKWQVSTAGGFSPRWRRDAKELYYMDPNGNLMSVAMKPGAGFASEIPKQLFHVEPAHDDYGQYDVAPDGSRFIVNVSGGNEALSITVALNWTSSLAR
jgi:Tol biopolymer transport system component